MSPDVYVQTNGTPPQNESQLGAFSRTQDGDRPLAPAGTATPRAGGAAGTGPPPTWPRPVPVVLSDGGTVAGWLVKPQAAERHVVVRRVFSRTGLRIAGPRRFGRQPQGRTRRRRQAGTLVYVLSTTGHTESIRADSSRLTGKKLATAPGLDAALSSRLPIGQVHVSDPGGGRQGC